MSAVSMDSELSNPLWFTVPEELHHVDLDEDPELRVRRTYQNVAATLTGASTAERLHVVFLWEVMLAQLASEGAVYVGHCLARSDSDPARLSTAQFSVLAKEADLSARRPLSAVASGLRKPDGSREVGFAEFSAGEALVVGEELQVRRPSTMTGKPEESVHRVRQAQVILPFPGYRRMAVLGVSSEDVGDWDHYVSMLNGIADSVSFTDPQAPSIADRLAGL